MCAVVSFSVLFCVLLTIIINDDDYGGIFDYRYFVSSNKMWLVCQWFMLCNFEHIRRSR